MTQQRDQLGGVVGCVGEDVRALVRVAGRETWFREQCQGGGHVASGSGS
jgi:hypothetical protein